MQNRCKSAYFFRDAFSIFQELHIGCCTRVIFQKHTEKSLRQHLVMGECTTMIHEGSWILDADHVKRTHLRLTNRMTSEKDLVAQDILGPLLEPMMREVTEDNTSPLERLLAEKVVATWLQVQLLEILCAA